MPTRSELARLTAANDELTTQLQRAIRRAWGALGAATADEKRDVMLDVLPGLIREHGQVAAVIAAEFFEATTGATATIIDPVEDAAVLESTRYLAGRLYDGREAAFLTGITSMATRNMLQHGRSTTYESALRTPGIFYARAPEPGACNWCLLLSSRGAVYASSTEAVKVSVARGKGGRRPGEDFHDSCRCDAIPARGDDDLPYDAGALYDKYKDAWYAAGGTGVTDAEVVAKMREMYGGH